MLHFATYKGDAGIVQLLIAKLDGSIEALHSTMRRSTMEGRVKVVKLLGKHGANLDYGAMRWKMQHHSTLQHAMATWMF